jgi:hypothetical protein
MAGDAEAVAAMYEAPLLAVRGGRAIHLPDDATWRILSYTSHDA